MQNTEFFRKKDRMRDPWLRMVPDLLRQLLSVSYKALHLFKCFEERKHRNIEYTCLSLLTPPVPSAKTAIRTSHGLPPPAGPQWGTLALISTVVMSFPHADWMR